MTAELLTMVRAELGTVMAEAVSGKLEKELQQAADLERLKRKELLLPREVEQLYGLKVSTLETWRCRGGGPDYVKLEGKLVYYRHNDIKGYIEARRVKGRA